MKEAIAVVDTTAADVKREVCRGQTPQDVPAAIYDALPPYAQQYITKNNNQFLTGCPGH